MPKYRAYATVKGSKYVGTFEAKNKIEAQNKAWESSGAYVSFCHQCSHNCEDAECSEMIIERVEDGEDAEVDNGDDGN